MEHRADSPFVSNVDVMKHFLSDGGGGSGGDGSSAPTPTPTAGVGLQQEDMDRLEDENRALRDENSRLALDLSRARQSLDELQLVYKKKDRDKKTVNVGRLFGWKK